MILQMQAEVHGLGYLGVSTCTYPIFSEFKAPKSDPFLPSLPSLTTICEGRGVVVICIEGSLAGLLRGSLAGWLAS